MSGGRDVIIRNVRSRPGNLSGTTLNGSGMSGSDHCIMDHVSISWGLDEELSTRTSKNVTFQRSLISEALNIAGHQNYPPGTKHGYAATVGGDVASLHHNLLAHNEGRNWSLGGGLDASGFFAGRLDIFNNVVYNWGNRTTDGGAHEVNFVNNYYKPGAASSNFYALNAQYDNFPGTQQYYFIGNVMPGHFGTNNQALGRTASNGTGTVPTNYSPWVSAPFFPSHATIHTATNAYKLVLSDVGCNQPAIDDHDVRVIRETLNGTYTYTGTGPYGGSPGLPNSQDDVGGWENYPFGQRPANFDSDHDGLPNWWETIKGLNPNSAPNDFSDSNGDPDGDEYTNLEDYLNWLAALHFDCTNGTTLDVDLTAFTRGFTNNSPVYTVSAATNGTVSLVAGRTARFTPTVSTNALGRFTFTVTDAQGGTMTNTVGVRILSTNLPPAQPPILGIRKQSGALLLELTGESGRNLTVQTKTNLAAAWLGWTNLTGSGAMQLIPLGALTNQSPRFFRAFAQ
jgi:Big-like domain-containing protein